MVVSKSSPDFCASCTYYIAVLGRTAASFSIVHTSLGTHTTLVPNSRLQHQVHQNEYRYYIVPKQPPDGSGDLGISLEMCFGEAKLYGSQTEVS